MITVFVQNTWVVVMKDYKIKGALILKKLTVCYKKLYSNKMRGRKCPGKGQLPISNTMVSRNSIKHMKKKALI